MVTTQPNVFPFEYLPVDGALLPLRFGPQARSTWRTVLSEGFCSAVVDGTAARAEPAIASDAAVAIMIFISSLLGSSHPAMRRGDLA
ncbi:hypothetical protein N182_23920 [Sinorhizobium sp. GL2]|nr:hypothetical protein N182_23920 [Sinorhizobium sp. GL2]